MKLYTEEQVLKAMSITAKTKDLTYLEVIKHLSPIELPSDEEIEDEFAPTNEIVDEVSYMFSEGAKWMRDKLTFKTKL